MYKNNLFNMRTCVWYFFFVKFSFISDNHTLIDICGPRSRKKNHLTQYTHCLVKTNICFYFVKLVLYIFKFKKNTFVLVIRKWTEHLKPWKPQNPS